MRRKVERLVGSHYSSAVPGFGPKSFPRGRRGSHRSCGGSIGRAVAIYSEPTSAFTVAPLVARKVERLVQRFHFSGFSCLEAAKTIKYARKSRFGARRAHFPDFQAVFSDNFHFMRHSADIFPYFSSVAVVVAISP